MLLLALTSGVVFPTIGLLLLLAFAWWGVAQLGVTGFPLTAIKFVLGIAVFFVVAWFITRMFNISLP